MVTQQYTFAYGAVSPQDGCFDSLVMPHVNSDCMQIFLDEIANRYPNDNLVMVLDGAGWHKSKDFRLPDNLRFLLLAQLPTVLPCHAVGWRLDDKRACCLI